MAITEQFVTGEGFAADLGLGSKRLCEKYGRPELSMTVKGQEFPAYDPRGIQGIGLAYATSNRGACHLRGYTIASEVLGIPVKTEMNDTDGKAELVKAFQDATALVDSAGLCVFTTFAWGMDNIAPQIDAACEGDWSVENCLETGERIWNMERLFNEAAGFTADDDKLPKRLLEGSHQAVVRPRARSTDSAKCCRSITKPGAGLRTARSRRKPGSGCLSEVNLRPLASCEGFFQFEER